MDGYYPISIQEQSTCSYGVDTFKLLWRFDEDRLLELDGCGRQFSSDVVGRGNSSRADKWRVHITKSPLKAVPKNNVRTFEVFPNPPSALLRLEVIDEPLVRILEWEYRSKRIFGTNIKNYSGAMKGDGPINAFFDFRPSPRANHRNGQRENVRFELTVVVGYARTSMYWNSCATIRTLREFNVVTDAILIPREGCGTPVHRVIISAQSRFFHAAFSGDSSKDVSESIEILMDVDSRVLEIFVGISYGACLDELSTEMLQNVYVVAGKYEAACIQQQAKYTLLNRNLKLEELVSFYIFAKRHGEKELRTKALKSVIAQREKFFINGGLDEIDESDEDVFEEFAKDFTNALKSDCSGLQRSL